MTDTTARAREFLVSCRRGYASAVAIDNFIKTEDINLLEVVKIALSVSSETAKIVVQELENYVFPIPKIFSKDNINVYNNIENPGSYINVRPRTSAIAERCPDLGFHECRINLYSISRLPEALAAADLYFEKLQVVADAAIAARYIAARTPVALYNALPGAVDLFTSTVLSLGQRPYVLSFEGIKELFQPYGDEGTSPQSPFYPVIRASLESPLCLAILTCNTAAAVEIGQFFNSDVIRSKCRAAVGDDLAGFYATELASAVARTKCWHSLQARPFRGLDEDRRLSVLQTGFDGLFLVNQSLDLAELVTAVHKTSLQTPLVVTTQQLFPEEMDELASQLPHAVITTMADWFDEEQLAEIDAGARCALQEGRSPYTGDVYTIAFNNENLDEQARLLRELTAVLVVPGAPVFYVPGLGISERVWKEFGQRIIPRSARSTPVQTAALVSQVAQPSLSVVSCKDEVYLFLTSLHRVRLAEDVVVETVPLPLDLFKRFQSASAEACREFIELARRYLPENHSVAITSSVHEYRSWMAQLGVPVNIVIDGYHPPNYSRSYIDYFARDARVLSREPVSAAWFSRFGWATRIEPSILAPLRFVPPILKQGEPLRILVALNHAGDWSAMIQRSDTDRLVEAAGVLAAELPFVEVRVRPHPTMAIAEHEGIHSHDRLAGHVATRNLPNLTMSGGSLAEDLAWCNFVVSEYSQVLIDGWAEGKPGLVVNLTGRRSFLQPYQDLGFAAVPDVGALVDKVRQVAQEPTDFLTRQSAAATRANHMFAATAGAGVSCPACGHGLIRDGISHLDFPPSRIKHCKSCGHGFAVAGPAAGQLEAYYQQGALRAWSILIGTSELRTFMRQRADAQVCFIEQFTGRAEGDEAPLLDVGCGLGTLCEAWSRSGRVAVGIDMDKAVVTAARLRMGTDLRVCDITAGLPANHRWRVISLSHVLEHVTDPSTLLEQARASLDQDGWLFIEVPGIQPGYFESRADMEGHLHFFTGQSLECLLERHGFHVESLVSAGPQAMKYGRTWGNEQENPCFNQYNKHTTSVAEEVWIRCIARLTPATCQ